jgi:drug/metabolite transporter (DMT)-like permease
MKEGDTHCVYSPSDRGFFMLKNILKTGPLLIITAAVLWALDGIVRRSLYSLPPITIVFFEHLIGSLILIPFIYKQFLKVKITKSQILIILFISLFSSLLGTLWFTTALLKVNFIPFSVVFLLQKLQPIFAISTAIVFLKEQVKPKYLLWASLAFVAAFFVTFKNGAINFQTGSGTIEAALYAVGAAIAWGSTTTFSRMVLLKLPDTYVTGLRFIFTTILGFFAVILMGASSSLTQVDSSQYLRFAFIALSTGMVALLIYYKGLKTTPVRVSTILELVFPVLAIAIDAILYKTFLAPTQLLAAAVLLFSIYKISRLTIRHEV